MATQLSWTPKQVEISQLLSAGKEFKEITDLGYTKNMVSRVKTALAEGQKPPEVEQDGSRTGLEPGGSGTGQPLVAVTGPRTSPLIFKFDQKQIVLDPLELLKQYRYYSDLAKSNNLGYTFSQVLTMGMQMVWILKQDIPLTENMLTAIFYG